MAIILEKGGDSHRINLEKGTGKPLTGEIVINLDWNKGGFLKSLFGNAVDLDLGCFYELRDGKKMLMVFSFLMEGVETVTKTHVRAVMTNLHIFGIRVMTVEVALLLEKPSW